MNKEKKQALIEWLRNEIKLIQSTQDEIPFGLDYDGEMAIKCYEIALASLTAEPVAWTPVLPVPEIVTAVNELLDVDGSRGTYSAMKCHTARENIEYLLAKYSEIS